MRSLARVEKEIWDRYKDGQNYEQISRMTRVPIRAVQNLIEERLILGEEAKRQAPKEKPKKMTSQPAE
jgi:hypothetical protein